MRCYLCASLENLTRDHVPPRGFFPPPLPSNLITVPCCNSCNHGYSLDDEAVRLWLSAAYGASKAGEWILEHKASKKTPKLIDALLTSIEEVKLLTVEHGEVDVERYEVPSDRIERFVIRVTKGLLTHHCVKIPRPPPLCDLCALSRPFRVFGEAREWAKPMCGPFS